MIAPTLGRNPALRIISDITDIPVAKWDALSGGDPFITKAVYISQSAKWDALSGGDPFTSHAYLHALQASGCATAEFGWQPRFTQKPPRNVT